MDINKNAGEKVRHASKKIRLEWVKEVSRMVLALVISNKPWDKKTCSEVRK